MAKKRRGRPKKRVYRVDLIEAIRSNMAEINERVEELRNEVAETGIKSDFLSNQLNIFRALTKTKSKKRVATGNLSRFNKMKLNDILEQQKKFLNSKWSTKEGRQEIDARRRQSFRNRGYDLTDEQYNIFTRLMSDDTLSQLREQKLLDSWQVLDVVYDNDPANKQKVMDSIDFINENLDYTKMESYEIKQIMEGYITGIDIETLDVYQKYKL